MDRFRRAVEMKMVRSGRPAFACAVACMAMLLSSARARAATITVNSTADVAANDGQCTLREAIISANTNTASGAAAGECAAGAAGLDTITFNVSGTITPVSALPTITEPVIIDGYTAPGASPNTNPVGSGLNTVLTIVIAGSNSSIGTSSTGGGSTIRGLNIQGNNLGSITFGPGSNGNTVRGCFVGTNVTGTAAGSGTPTAGIIIAGANNVVGGTTPAARNLLSGTLSGVTFALLPGEDNNVIQGNLIGTNAAGTAAIPNGTGIFVQTGGFTASNTLIGGTVAGARNVISGNSNAGIDLEGNGGTPGTTVQGNFIGTDVTGTLALGNGTTGVFIGQSNGNNTIGGTAAGAGNVISANGQEGIRIINTQSNANNVVQGNLVGTNAAGTAGLGGQPNGGILVFSPSNTIGGTSAGAANLVAFNGGVGVSVTNSTAGVAIETNSIHDNGGVGILTVTPLGDPDMFPPTLTSASISAGTLTVSGTHNGGTADKLIHFEFFSNVACDASGSGEGQTYLGFADVLSDLSGNLTFGPLLFPGVPGGQTIITATATSLPLGSTSAFSACFNAGAAPSPTPTPTLTPTATPTAPGPTPTPTLTPTVTPSPGPGAGAAPVPTLGPGLMGLFGAALAVAALLLLRKGS